MSFFWVFSTAWVSNRRCGFADWWLGSADRGGFEVVFFSWCVSGNFHVVVLAMVSRFGGGGN